MVRREIRRILCLYLLFHQEFRDFRNQICLLIRISGLDFFYKFFDFFNPLKFLFPFKTLIQLTIQICFVNCNNTSSGNRVYCHLISTKQIAVLITVIVMHSNTTRKRRKVTMLHSFCAAVCNNYTDANRESFPKD